MVNECSESYRNGQELSNVYAYLRHHIPHLLPRPPACSLLRQLSQLLLFSDSIQQSAVFVVLFCLFLCAAATTILSATLLRTTQLKIFLCEENLHNNNAKENKKF